MDIDYDTYNATFNTLLFQLGKDARESGAEELVEQGEALGIYFDYDGLVLTPEQR